MTDIAEQTVRIPAGVMGLLRQSYDSRERVLDWCLAIGVTVTLAWAFRGQLRDMCGLDGDPSVNAGRDDPPQPSQDVDGAFPLRTGNDVYTYNMPVSRRIVYRAGPSGTGLPTDPAAPPTYSPDEA